MNELTTTEQQQVSTQDRSQREAVYKAFGSGEVIRLNVAMVKNFLAKPTRQGKAPTDGDCFRFIALCKARALNPFEGDAFIVGYDGQDGPEFSLITAEQAFLKRTEANEQFRGMTSGVIIRREDGTYEDREGKFVGEGETLVGGWCIVWKKIADERVPFKSRLNLSVFDKGNRFWKSNPAGLIVKCAEADSLRHAFPSILGGLHTIEETGTEIDITPKPQNNFVSPAFGATEAPKQLEQPQPNEPAKRGPGRPRKEAAAPSPAPAQTTAPEATPADQPTPPAPSPAVEPTASRTPQEELAAILETVPFEFFHGWLITTGFAREELAAQIKDWASVPDGLASTLLKPENGPKLARCVKLYGKPTEAK